MDYNAHRSPHTDHLTPLSDSGLIECRWRGFPAPCWVCTQCNYSIHPRHIFSFPRRTDWNAGERGAEDSGDVAEGQIDGEVIDLHSVSSKIPDVVDVVVLAFLIPKEAAGVSEGVR
jgi:hypothetical protein